MDRLPFLRHRGLRAATGCTLVVVGACQDDYPLEPTACDDWCHATERISCGFDDPAACVAGCEAERFVSDDPACQGPWQSMVDCYWALPDEALCPSSGWPSGSPSQSCLDQSAVYYQCAFPGNAPVR